MPLAAASRARPRSPFPASGLGNHRAPPRCASPLLARHHPHAPAASSTTARARADHSRSDSPSMAAARSRPRRHIPPRSAAAAHRRPAALPTLLLLPRAPRRRLIPALPLLAAPATHRHRYWPLRHVPRRSRHAAAACSPPPRATPAALGRPRRSHSRLASPQPRACARTNGCWAPVAPVPANAGAR
nr:uncharacterized protein LOC109787252 [Aegilops tauschii subsp. strangulata]